MLRNGTLNDAQPDTLHAHAHRHALAAEEVVFGDGGGVLDAFLRGFVVYIIFRPDAEGVGVVGLAFIEICAARVRVGDKVLAGGKAGV